MIVGGALIADLGLDDTEVLQSYTAQHIQLVAIILLEVE